MSVFSRIDRVAAQDTQLPVGLCAGTSVRTPCGLRRIENICPGDLVVTRKDGLQPVRMVWTRKIAATEVAADPSLAPVVIAPRAIGPMMPQHELRVAGSHRILLPGYRVEGVSDTDVCMVSARDFAHSSKDARIDRESREIRYFNLVFDQHQIFAANGLMVESFLPTAVSVSGLDEKDRAALEAAIPAVDRYKPVGLRTLATPISLSA